MMRWLASRLARRPHSSSPVVPSTDPLVHAIDSPKVHRIRWGETNRFDGVVFHVGNRAIDRLAVSRDGEPVGEFPVDKPSEVIDRHVPHLTSARRCRFVFDLRLDAEANVYGFEIVYGDGGREKLLDLDVRQTLRQRGRLDGWNARLDALPMPPGRLVELTQGHEDVTGYRDSIVPAILGIERYLESAGVPLEQVRRCLDFGCGSGRLLTGWWLADPTRQIHGCDINAELIAWASEGLPDTIRVLRNDLLPPLPYPDASFDLVTALSVFTHLSLETQRAWIAELRRVLAPGGWLLVTLLGRPYVELFDAPRLEEFEEAGTLERVTPVEGGNAYGSFHTPAFARTLFSGFDLAGVFPSGRLGGERVLAQIAAVQDVYVFRLR